MNELHNAFKANTLASIKALVKNDEQFAIDILDILTDEVWEKEDMIEIINEVCPSYEKVIAEVEEINLTDMNADDTEHAKAYEADIRRGL